jgi:hypothetical protein
MALATTDASLWTTFANCCDEWHLQCRKFFLKPSKHCELHFPAVRCYRLSDIQNCYALLITFPFLFLEASFRISLLLPHSRRLRVNRAFFSHWCVKRRYEFWKDSVKNVGSLWYRFCTSCTRYLVRSYIHCPNNVDEIQSLSSAGVVYYQLSLSPW